MARKVFFSFHYQRDIWRVSQIRNSWVTKDRDTAGFWDSADWEKVKKGGENEIEKWIEEQLKGTSVTVVLIGKETNDRKFVDHEIKRSRALGKGILGVRIHNLKDSNGNTDSAGTNPFDQWHTTINGVKTYFSQIYKTYDWVHDDGHSNFSKWVEDAAKAAGK